MRTTQSKHYYCSMPGGHPDCIRGWEHSGDCKPGCRICNIDTHLTLACPSGHADHDYTPEPDDMAMFEAEHPRPPAPETKAQHWLRRGPELSRQRKTDLVALYRRLGGLGGIHPPEKWRKEEIVTSIIEMEWTRLPEERRLPDPPSMTPPCDICGKGENATAHRYGGDHHYRFTHNPDAKWVPESEAEAERLEKLAADRDE